MYEEIGLKALSLGKVAALVVAGGQASRLQLSGSKGLFPITPIRHKTLFQIFAEKTLACSRWVHRDLSLCFMTSPSNDEEIQTYFQENHFFGLKPENVHFFSQGVYPFKNLDGTDLIIDGKRLEGPDGNGSALEKIKESKLLDRLKKSGVETLTFSMIDNPLIDPFDARLIGYQISNHLDAALIAIPRLEGEKTGAVVETEQGVRVIEYTELEPDKNYPLANISAFAFSVDFIERAALEKLPMHEHKKEVRPNLFAYKYEKFIFDCLPFAKRSGMLTYPREEVFAPLKNREGPNSPETVMRALQARDREVYERISGLQSPDHPFELDFSFYYPTRELLDKWKGRPLPKEGYIV